MRSAIAAEAAKSMPPVAVVTGYSVGLTISDTVGILTCVWVIAQLSYLIWKWRREAKQ